MSSLKTAGGETLLLPEAVGFWSEHSDRAGVDGWLATLGVEQSLRAFVGRWSRQGAADLYVRTSLRVTENLQRLSAVHAQDSFQGGADHFGEEHLLDQLRSYLRAQGVSEVSVEAQIRRLTVADFTKMPTPMGTISSAGNVELEDMVVLPALVDGAVTEAEDPEEVLCQDLVEACAERVLQGREEGPKGFVISKTRGGKVRRVHFVGGCFRVPGEHYRDYEDLGQRAPLPHEITHRCKDCFPLERESERQVENEELASDTSGESSSSDGSQEATPPTPGPEDAQEDGA